MKHTQEPWMACRKGECPCGQIWTNDYPIAEVFSGKWGDDFPSIRLTGPSSLELKAEPFMDQITYGEIDPELAKANAKRIIECVNALAGIENPEDFVQRAKAVLKS